MKTVEKPWGLEEWLELNLSYCLKRIFIWAGHRTSLQYHTLKLETNLILAGTGEITLGDAVQPLAPFASVTVRPQQIHRIAALTDLEIVEVSTPEVEDVVRLQDDYGRL